MDLEDLRNVGQVSTIMRLINSKDSDLSSCFDKNAEKVLDNNNPLKQMIISNYADEVNKGKIKGQLPLGHKFGFFKSFKKLTKNLGFHLTFKMNDLQDIIFTTITTDIDVTLNSLYLNVPILNRNSQPQLMLNEAIMNNYTITFDSWYTERIFSNDGRELQVDIASAQHINSPKILISAFQTNVRTTPSKARNPAIFDTNHVMNKFVEIDGVCFNKVGVLTIFAENSFLDQYRDSKLFRKEYVDEEFLQPYKSYRETKHLYPIQVTDFRHQVNHFTPKKIQFFEEFDDDLNVERLFIILVRHRQVEMISDGNKIVEVKVI